MAALVAIFSTQGCRQPAQINQPGSMQFRKGTQEQRHQLYKNEIYPEARKLAASGDIAVRMGTDLTSLLISALNPSGIAYSHCGIISIESDSAWVYHAIGGEFNPDQKMKREPLYDFAQPENNCGFGIFRPQLTHMQRQAFISLVQDQYKNGLAFDMDFNLNTDNKQYCTEMVAKNIGKVTGRADWVRVIETTGKRFIPVESILHNILMKEKKHFQY